MKTMIVKRFSNQPISAILENKKKIIVIGAGFAGLSAATYLAHQGCDVTILEKNEVAGGRARQYVAEGFTFDMGPSWYWMPDIFEQYFADFGKKRADYYDLVRLDPSYTVFFNENQIWNIPAKMSELEALFERAEAGSTIALRQFLKEAAYKYQTGIGEFVQKPSQSITEFIDIRILKSVFRLDMFTSMSKHLQKWFKNPKLIQLLEFPVLFLGATPQNTPALYSMMNYADMSLGTWYPMGGMFEIVKGMVRLAEEKGVRILLNQEVKQIIVDKKKNVTACATNTNHFEADYVIAGADYHHIEQVVLPSEFRHYSAAYWDKRVMAPSSLIFYLGVNKRLTNLNHHNLFFDEDFNLHAKEIYETPKLPTNPLFYVCVPSVTDATVAPEGCENLFILIPLAPNLPDEKDDWREKYYDMVMTRLEKLTGQSVRDAVIYKRSYAHRDFQKDYHAFKGNAYGLANTLMQTAFLKPKLKNKHLNNLYYTGQLTVPGPGVPPSLISGKIVSKVITKRSDF
jgi:phytoene desaturase